MSKARGGVAGLVLALALGAVDSTAVVADAVITLPVRVHIVRDLTMHKRGVTMASWVTPADIRQVVVPEANRIWRGAGIQWLLDGVAEVSSKHTPTRAETIQYVQSARRDARGKSDPQRIQRLYTLLDTDRENRNAINVYLIPYLGETSQGHTKGKQRRILLGQWTDKPSKAREAPRKVLLREGLPFRQGSLGRTLAHELGHVLKLKHPDKRTQTHFGLLMGGKKAGYTITPAQISRARARAQTLFH